MIHIRFTMALSALLTAVAFAQTPEPPPPPGAHVFVMRTQDGALPDASVGMAQAKIRLEGLAQGQYNIEMGVEGKTVKGAPYSAQAVSETTQTLADGTRISRKTSSTLARDSEGRTRREETLSSVGPWSTEGQAHTVVFLNDPVTQAHYVVDTAQHSATKTIARNVQIVKTMTRDGGASTETAQEAKQLAERLAAHKADRRSVKTESLGNQTISGVVATGTRRTRTIPAGEIGNDRAIDIVSETWYSDELQMTVMSKHSDPRSGETTYTLSNIQRAEPDASLFAVPAGYNIQENSRHFTMDRNER